MEFHQLETAYEQELIKLEAALRDFPWEDKRAYANWCAQTYYYVCHSTRLLALSAAGIPLAQNEIYVRFLKHLREEAGHEHLALNDVKKLGFALADFPELSSTAAFYQTQYYYVDRVQVFSLLGYILLLEGLSAKYGPACYERAKDAHGKDATHFWKVHAEEDPEHVSHALAYVKKAGPDSFAAILRNLQDSASRYADILTACAKAAKQDQSKGKAA